MIHLQVIDRSAAPMYGSFGRGVLTLPDDVQCIRWEAGLVLIEDKRKHWFNKAGEYTGTEKL